jgi:hypothetical protein
MAGKYESRNEQGDHRIADDDPKALKVLKTEHQIFRALFDRAEDASTEERVEIARELCMRLTVHMTIEEEILYPEVRKLGEEDEVNEGVVEHGAGKVLIAEIEQLDGTEELYKAKVHVLGEETIHHIDEEDEDMFAEAKEAHKAGKIDLDEIGDRLEARQKELYDQIAQAGEVGDTDEEVMEEVKTA